MRKNLLLILFQLFSIILFTRCKSEQPLTDQDLTTKWADMTLYITKNTPSNSPTYSSRCLGYIGLTMYESVVNGYPNYQSLSGQLDGLDSVPKPILGKKYDWKLSLNAAQATILRTIYNQTSDKNKLKIDSLEKSIQENYTQNSQDKELIDRSVAYGKAIALRIFEWSKTDGGHRGYLKNFDKKDDSSTQGRFMEFRLCMRSHSVIIHYIHIGEKNRNVF